MRFSLRIEQGRQTCWGWSALVKKACVLAPMLFLPLVFWTWFCGFTKAAQMKEMEKYRRVAFKGKQKLSGFRLIRLNLSRDRFPWNSHLMLKRLYQELSAVRRHSNLAYEAVIALVEWTLIRNWKNGLQ